MKTLAAILIFGVLYSSLSLAQSLYKSVGPDGKIVYSDRPPSEGRLEKTMEFKNLPASSLPPSQLEQLQRNKTGQQAAIGNDQTTLFTTAWCGYCKKAKAYLSKKGINFKEVDIETSSGMTAYAQAGGTGGVPLLVHRDKRVRGFSVDAYDALFGR